MLKDWDVRILVVVLVFAVLVLFAAMWYDHVVTKDPRPYSKYPELNKRK